MRGRVVDRRDVWKRFADLLEDRIGEDASFAPTVVSTVGILSAFAACANPATLFTSTSVRRDGEIMAIAGW